MLQILVDVSSVASCSIVPFFFDVYHSVIYFWLLLNVVLLCLYILIPTFRYFVGSITFCYFFVFVYSFPGLMFVIGIRPFSGRVACSMTYGFHYCTLNTDFHVMELFLGFFFYSRYCHHCCTPPFMCLHVSSWFYIQILPGFLKISLT